MAKTVAQTNEKANLTRVDFVIQAIRGQILKGQLKQGMRLREEELADQLGVSRTPVREALSRLQARGLVEMATGRGLVVAEISGTKIVELYSLRAVLEGAAARFAAEHASQGEVSLLMSLVNKCANSTSAADAVYWNRQFHAMICDIARNRFLGPALRELYETVALIPGTTLDEGERLKQASEEHKQIVEAISNHQPDAAEQLARRHVNLASQIRVEQSLQIQNEPL